MRLCFGADFVVGGGSDDEGMEDGILTACESSRFAVVAMLETSASVLGLMFDLSSSRFRLPDDGVVVDPFRCSSVLQPLTGTLEESFAADATRSLCLWSGLHLFFGRVVSIYLK